MKIRDLAKTTAVLILATILVAGCPTQDDTGGAVEECEEIGQQCKLGGGQLGVCSMDVEGNLECAPQH